METCKYKNSPGKSREEVAYTLVDMESGISDIVVDNLEQVKGILSVRAL